MNNSSILFFIGSVGRLSKNGTFILLFLISLNLASSCKLNTHSKKSSDLATFVYHGNEFPNILHFVWFGGVPPIEVQNNMLNWINSNPNLDVYFWVSKEDIESRISSNRLRNNGNKYFNQFVSSLEIDIDYNQVIRFLRNTFGARVEFKNIEDLKMLYEFKKTAGPNRIKIDQYNELYKRFKQEAFFEDQWGLNLAAASDIFRLLILYKYGGIYLDGDVASFDYNYKIDLPLNSHGIRIYSVCSGNIYTYKALNNDIIAAVPGNSIVEESLKKIIENYKALETNGGKLASYIYGKYFTTVYSNPPKYEDKVIRDAYQGLDEAQKNHPEASPLNSVHFLNIDINKINTWQKKRYGLPLEIFDIYNRYASSKQTYSTATSGPDVIANEFRKAKIPCHAVTVHPSWEGDSRGVDRWADDPNDYYRAD